MWISKYGWKDHGTGEIYVSNQEDNIKTKNITEKITFESKSFSVENYLFNSFFFFFFFQNEGLGTGH